jgi:hypothetical protein
LRRITSEGESLSIRWCLLLVLIRQGLRGVVILRKKPSGSFLLLNHERPTPTSA